jgi:hypothetical protein
MKLPIQLSVCVLYPVTPSQKGALDSQPPAHIRLFSPGAPTSSTTKTGRHDIAEILLKVALKHQKSINLVVISTKLQTRDISSNHGWKKSEHPERTTEYGLAAASRVHPFCNLQSRARTHAVLVIGLYDLLGNPTT